MECLDLFPPVEAEKPKYPTVIAAAVPEGAKDWLQMRFPLMVIFTIQFAGAAGSPAGYFYVFIRCP
jgi:hypothetical protein